MHISIPWQAHAWYFLMHGGVHSARNSQLVIIPPPPIWVMCMHMDMQLGEKGEEDLEHLLPGTRVDILKAQQELLRESTGAKTVSPHPNIVRLVAVVRPERNDTKAISLLYEYMPGGSLAQLCRCAQRTPTGDYIGKADSFN